MWFARSFDAPARADGEGSTLGEIAIARQPEVHEQVEAAWLADVLGEVDEDAVAAMSEAELVALRATLAREGIRPSVRRPRAA